MDGGGVSGQRSLRRVVVGQDRIFDADQSQRGAGCVRVVGSHCRHLVAHEPYACVEDGEIRSQASFGRVEGRHHSANAGQAQGLGGVDTEHVGVGVWAAQDGAVEHSRQLEVGGIAGRAGQFGL